jgi:hypothetical protein
MDNINISDLQATELEEFEIDLTDNENQDYSQIVGGFDTIPPCGTVD